MTTDRYTYLLAHPQEIDESHMKALETVVEKFPYFQSARALQLKGLKNQGSYLYNEALKKTAAHTTDRDILFDYITSEEFVQNKISEQILQHDPSVNEIEVIAENVSEAVSVDLDNKMKAELKKAEAILNPELFERKVASVVDLTETPTSETTATEKPSDTVKPEAPLPFTKADTHSFAEWLKLTKAEPIEREETTGAEDENEEEKARKFALIDKFIQETPKLEPTSRPSEGNKNLAKPFTKPQESLMTETLAKVYLQQKNYKKAIQAYKILILKNPEKSGFFADQIRAIEKLKNS
ncbi:hypothetical protein [Altibacter sp. HG106]|uniref:hypothetical protein n=1 Tax=Altibacter sp. HG106 TaxID=3023937 RepID=UPI0023505EF8|nr:hypothetical protein [Altibacter sp. HG106]MDC7994303.1 hypothetical protein [Altibacter sp. HG106]